MEEEEDYFDFSSEEDELDDVGEVGVEANNNRRGVLPFFQRLLRRDDDVDADEQVRVLLVQGVQNQRLTQEESNLVRLDLPRLDELSLILYMYYTETILTKPLEKK